jgi:hypothetical protein
MDQLFPVHPKKSPAAYKLRTVEHTPSSFSAPTFYQHAGSKFSQHVAVYADIQQ